MKPTPGAREFSASMMPYPHSGTQLCSTQVGNESIARRGERTTSMLASRLRAQREFMLRKALSLSSLGPVIGLCTQPGWRA